MPTRRSPQSDQVHELKITLSGSRPPIWRRVAVPSDCTLAELHEIIQIAMGWFDEHLHQFRLKMAPRKLDPLEEQRLIMTGRWNLLETLTSGERRFTDRRVEDMEGEDERKFTIGELCPDPKGKLIYEYDFGDGWEHRVEVMKVGPAAPDVRYPACLTGKLACPPEDCGGIWGYYDMLAAIAAPQHPEHEERLEWLGNTFDPEAFDLEGVNQVLAKWRRHRPRAAKPRRGRQRSR